MAAAEDQMEVDGPEPEVEEEEPPERTFPCMALAHRTFVFESAEPGEDLEVAKAEVLKSVEDDAMAPYYEHLCARFGWAVDAELLQRMTAANSAEQAKLEADVVDAEQNHGESEVLDALFAIAMFQARIGAKDAAFAAFEVIIDKPKVSTGKKIDACLGKLRVALFFQDTETVRPLIASTKKMVDDGGDWDRRNRLKVYEAVYLMVVRDFKTAAELFLDGVATFTCVELCTFEQFIFYAVVTNLLYLKRPELKKKIVEGPDLLGVLPGLPPLPALVNGLYDCEYRTVFASLLPLNTALLRDRYVARHARYLIREYRILVYSQYLNAYKSVMLDSMAAAFGVPQTFLDDELSRFIAAKRLNAKIDKVGGLVETNRPDVKNSQYHGVIKKGDLLLNQIQKLARVIDV